MKPLFKWWIALELSKLLLIAISLLLEERLKATICLLFLLTLFTLVSYSKIWPLFRQITNKLFVEEDLSHRKLLSRVRLTLLFLMLLDLIPFVPLIQALLRYGYYRNSDQINEALGLVA